MRFIAGVPARVRGGSAMLISVVIPARNAAATLGECLDAVRKSSYPQVEVVVVDDCSDDTTASIARDRGCQVVCSASNLGAANARNLGANAASGEIILFTDADILLPPNALSRVAAALADTATAGVVGLLGPQIRFTNLASQFKNLWMYYTYSRLAASTAAREGVGLFFTSIAAIRKPVFEQMGGFDTNYQGTSVTEDIEFGQRLLTAGHRILLDGGLQVEHLKHYTLRQVLKTDLERAAGLTRTYLRKKLEPQSRQAGEKYYASVPLTFGLSVPLAWLLPLLLLLALCTASGVWLAIAAMAYLALLALNLPFLFVLVQQRGLAFGLQSCLFLPADLWVSGLGAAWGIVDYLRGKRY